MYQLICQLTQDVVATVATRREANQFRLAYNGPAPLDLVDTRPRLNPPEGKETRMRLQLAAKGFRLMAEKEDCRREAARLRRLGESCATSSDPVLLAVFGYEESSWTAEHEKAESIALDSI